MQVKITETIDASGLDFRQLNERIRALADNGCKRIILKSVFGQRYIGTALGSGLEIIANGTVGNDSAMFMSGATLIVNGSAQDCLGNTMDDGIVVVHGHSGDTIGHGMRGGEIYVRDSVGTRVGIHMKSYQDKRPVIVIGGCAGDFFGEYMAGGILIVLSVNRKNDNGILGRFVGTGMHGGAIYVRGSLDDNQLAKEVKVFPIEEADRKLLSEYIKKYCKYFEIAPEPILKAEFTKLQPYTTRPYGKLYAY